MINFFTIRDNPLAIITKSIEETDLNETCKMDAGAKMIETRKKNDTKLTEVKMQNYEIQYHSIQM